MSVNKEQSLQIFESGDREVGGHHRLHPLHPGYPDANISGLEETNNKISEM